MNRDMRELLQIKIKLAETSAGVAVITCGRLLREGDWKGIAEVATDIAQTLDRADEARRQLEEDRHAEARH